MTANNEQQIDEIIELTEVVEEGTTQKQTIKKEAENVDAFPKEKAVESKDFDEELSDILESVIDDEPKAEEGPEKDAVDDLSFDDLFEEEIPTKDEMSSEEPLAEEEDLIQDDPIVQSSATPEEIDDEFAELDNIIADLDEDSPDQVLENASVEEEIISDLEKSVQQDEPEHKKLDENLLMEESETSKDRPESQDIDKVAALADKLINLEQRIDKLETGFEDKLAQIKADLLNEINAQMDKQVKPQITEMLATELDPLKQKIAQVEEKLDNLSIPGSDEIKEIISQEITRALDERSDDDNDAKADEKLQEYVADLVNQKLEEKASEWHREKETLAKEVEDALKYWGKLQDRLEKLASELDKIKDKPASEEFTKQIEDISHRFVSRDDLKLLASQLKIEMEEFITKKVPLTAAQVIREEISALLTQKAKK